jgi:hypothetical protein
MSMKDEKFGKAAFLKLPTEEIRRFFFPKGRPHTGDIESLKNFYRRINNFKGCKQYA